MTTIDVIGPGGDVIEQVQLEPGVAVRLAHDTVRLTTDPAAAPADAEHLGSSEPTRGAEDLADPYRVDPYQLVPPPPLDVAPAVEPASPAGATTTNTATAEAIGAGAVRQEV